MVFFKRRTRLCFLFLFVALAGTCTLYADTIPSGFRQQAEGRTGLELSPAYVPGTRSFLREDNPYSRDISHSLCGSLCFDFSFNKESVESILYPGLYQGIEIGSTSFTSDELMGNPVSVYVYQGAPIVRFGPKLWLGYGWTFGVAFGWKHYTEESPDNNAVVSTSVTAHIACGLKLN